MKIIELYFNLQTRLTNITNILNTQNIEFTDNVSDMSSAGSKLYIQPQVYLKLSRIETYGNEIRYLNITPYLTGKYNFPDSDYQLGITCSLKINFDFNENEWLITLGPNSIKNLSVGINNTIESISTIDINGNLIYSNNAVIERTITASSFTQITLNTVSGKTNFINISFFY